MNVWGNRRSVFRELWCNKKGTARKGRRKRTTTMIYKSGRWKRKRKKRNRRRATNSTATALYPHLRPFSISSIKVGPKRWRQRREIPYFPTLKKCSPPDSIGLKFIFASFSSSFHVPSLLSLSLFLFESRFSPVFLSNPSLVFCWFGLIFYRFS